MSAPLRLTNSFSNTGRGQLSQSRALSIPQRNGESQNQTSTSLIIQSNNEGSLINPPTTTVSSSQLKLKTQPSLTVQRIKDESEKDGLLSQNTLGNLFQGAIADIDKHTHQDESVYREAEQVRIKYETKKLKLDEELSGFLSELIAAVKKEEPGAQDKMNNYLVISDVCSKMATRFFEDAVRSFDLMKLQKEYQVNYFTVVATKYEAYSKSLKVLEQQIDIIRGVENNELANKIKIADHNLKVQETVFAQMEKTYSLYLKKIKIENDQKNKETAEKNKHTQEMAKIDAEIKEAELKCKIEMQKIMSEEEIAKIKAEADKAIAREKAEADKVNYRNRRSGCIIC